MFFRGFLGLSSVNKVIEVSNSETQSIDFQNIKTLELKVMSPDALFVFHNSEGFYGEVFDSSMNFLTSIYPKTDTFLNIKEEGTRIRIENENNLQKLDFSVLFYSKNGLKECNEYILSTDASKSFVLTGKTTEKVENSFSVTGKNSVCYWIASPNIKEVTVEHSKPNIYKKDDFGQNCVLFTTIEPFEQTDSIIISSTQIESPQNYKIFKSQFFPSDLINLKNGNAIKSVDSSLDQIISTSGVSKLTLNCVKSAAVLFHSSDCEINVYNSEGDFISKITNKSPAFKFSAFSGGKIVISEFKSPYVYFSTVVMNDIACDEISLTTVLNKVEIKPSDSNLCVWISSINEYSIQSDNIPNANFAVKLSDGTSNKYTNLKIDSAHFSTLIHYTVNKAQEKSYKISLNSLSAEKGDIEIVSRFKNSAESFNISSGDYSSKELMIDINVTKPFDKIVEIHPTQKLKLNVPNPYTVILIHNPENVEKEAVIGSKKLSFDRIFYFGGNAGYINLRSKKSEPVLISISAANLDCTYNVISNKFDPFVLADPTETSDYTLITEKSSSYCYWIVSDKMLKVNFESFVKDMYGSIIVYNKENAVSYSSLNPVSRELETNNTLIRLTVKENSPDTYLRISPLIKDSIVQKNPIHIVFKKQEDSCEVTQDIAYHLTNIEYSITSSCEKVLYNNGMSVILNINCAKSLLIIHDIDYSAKFYRSDTLIGKISPKEGSFGAGIVSTGKIIFETKLPSLHFAVISTLFKTKTCTYYGVSTSLSPFIIMNYSFDKDDVRNITIKSNTNVCYIYSMPFKTKTKIRTDLRRSDMFYGFSAKQELLSFLFDKTEYQIETTTLLTITTLSPRTTSQYVNITHSLIDKRHENDTYFRTDTTFESFSDIILKSEKLTPEEITESVSSMEIIIIVGFVVIIIFIIVFIVCNSKRLCFFSDNDDSTSLSDIDEYRRNVSDIMNHRFDPDNINVESNQTSESESAEDTANESTNQPSNEEIIPATNIEIQSPYTNPYDQTETSTSAVENNAIEY